MEMNPRRMDAQRDHLFEPLAAQLEELRERFDAAFLRASGLVSALRVRGLLFSRMPPKGSSTFHQAADEGEIHVFLRLLLVMERIHSPSLAWIFLPQAKNPG